MDSWAQTTLTQERDLERHGTVPMFLQICSITAGKLDSDLFGHWKLHKITTFCGKATPSNLTHQN